MHAAPSSSASPNPIDTAFWTTERKAEVARRLYRLERKAVDEAFLAGSLRRSGTLVEAFVLRRELSKAREPRLSGADFPAPVIEEVSGMVDEFWDGDVLEPLAWRGRYWGLTAEELHDFVGLPGQYGRAILSRISETDELIVERFALVVYVRSTLWTMACVGLGMAMFVGGLRLWRTGALVVTVILTAPYLARLAAAALWSFECNYRRLIGQFRNGTPPSAIRPDAPHWPVLVVLRIVPAIGTIIAVLFLGKFARAIGL